MSILYHICILVLVLSFCITNAISSPKPKALILPISKDFTTNQYLTKFSLGTPLVSKNFVLDVGGENIWMACQSGYKSSTSKHGQCGSAACSLLPKGYACLNNTCSPSSRNTITGEVDYHDKLVIDTMELASTDGSKSGPSMHIPSFIFACTENRLVKGLSKRANGMAGLGRSKLALPDQLSAALGGTLKRKFALCLPSSNKNGVLFFGDTQYKFYASDDKTHLYNMSEGFTYTDLYVNPYNAYTRGKRSAEYYVNVTSVLINGYLLDFDATLLSIDNRGKGGSKISTIHPYTTLHTSIYQALTKQFNAAIRPYNVTKVAPIAPFTECYHTKNLKYNIIPFMQVVFGNGDSSWSFYDVSLLVNIRPNVRCLAFVDGGSTPTTSVVFGAFQFEDTLLEFDVANSRLGFTVISSVARCSNFNF